MLFRFIQNILNIRKISLWKSLNLKLFKLRPYFCEVRRSLRQKPPFELFSYWRLWTERDWRWRWEIVDGARLEMEIGDGDWRFISTLHSHYIRLFLDLSGGKSICGWMLTSIRRLSYGFIGIIRIFRKISLWKSLNLKLFILRPHFPIYTPSTFSTHFP